MSLVTFRRIADAPPPLRELLEIEPDGSFRMWRSVGEAVGRFAGTVPDAEALGGLVAAARDAAVPETGPHPADATIDEIEAGDATLELRPSQRPDGPWGDLAARLRALLKELTSRPEAAIALVIPGQGGFDRVRLEHRGSRSLPINLGALAVTLEVFRDTTTVASGQGEEIEAREVLAEPGWSVEVPVQPLEVPPGTVLLARARFVADDGGVKVPMTAEAVLEG